MEGFGTPVIFAQVGQVVGEAVGDSNSARIAVAELGPVFGGYIARERFFSLALAISAAACADFKSTIEYDVDGRATGSASQPEARGFGTTRQSFLISSIAPRVAK
jgi:hypothetical protein